MPTDKAVMIPEQDYYPGRPLPDITHYGLTCEEYEQARTKFLEVKRHRDEVASQVVRLQNTYQREANRFASEAVEAMDASSGNGFSRAALREPLEKAKKRIQRLEKELEENWLQLQALNTGANKAYAQAHSVLRGHGEELSLQLAEKIRSEAARAQEQLAAGMAALQTLSPAYDELLRISNPHDPTQMAPEEWGLPFVNPVNTAAQAASQSVGKAATAQSVLAAALQARSENAALEAMVIGEGANSEVDVTRAVETARELEAAAVAALAADEGAS